MPHAASPLPSFIYFYLFIYFMFWLCWIFIAAHRLFSTCGEQGLLCCGLRASHCGGFSCPQAWVLGARPSVVAARGLSSCGAGASLLHSVWDLPGSGIKPVSRALAGGFLTTAPPGKSLGSKFLLLFYFMYTKFVSVNPILLICLSPLW